ncbi:hypothetical protein [Devosia sp. Root635]|uniref:hypothetical protein n=1 Tax=Devosia sp. Root635 TaxID=1736575 RepID=UPI0007011A42|nr:hypothetical protein [Devosia sp. Root635]KRA43265.1 hypothetical protein ASD80_08435 [Devosia sp. Root635]
MRFSIILLASAALALPASAADLGVLTALDVCDELGLTGLTVSSDSNCLQVSAELYYEFHWGDYKGALPVLASGYSGTIDWTDSDGAATDWDSWVDAYLKVVGTAPTDVGPARAVIEIYQYDYAEAQNGVGVPDAAIALDQAYIAIGDTTVLTAGLVESSIFNEDDDDAFGWLPSFISDETDGVAWDGGTGTYGYEGHAIQLTGQLGNGLSAGVALEDLDGDGSLIGVVNYAGDTLTAHISVLAGQVLDGTFNDLALHSGVTATFDAVKLRAALAANNSGWWNALASAEARFDMFTLAATVDATSARELGLVGSAEARLNDQFTVKLAARYLDADTALADDQGAELRGRIEYAVAESLTLAAEAGHLWTGAAAPSGIQGITDGLLELTWTPGGDFEASTAIAANSLGAYKASFTASKSYQ